MAELNNTSTGQWSETDASNISASPDGWPSGTYPNQVEPIGRSTMGAIKRFWDRINGTITTSGSSNAYVYSPVNTSYPTAYVTGEIYTFIPNFTNTGACTININSLGAKSIYVRTSTGTSACSGGEIVSGQITSVAYDGTNFQLLAPSLTSTNNTVIATGTSTAHTLADRFGLYTYYVQDFNTTGSSDLTTALQAAITALPSTGGVIVLPRGSFTISSTIDLSSRASIQLVGQGGRTGGAGSGTILTYTGTASYAFNCHSSIDIVFKDMQIFWNNSGFSGFLIDFLNATYGTISHCQMFANGLSNIGMQGICVNFKNTQNMVIEKCAFGACYNAINGIVGAGSFSNNVVVRDCEFIGSRVAPIQAPGTWCIENCTFEPVTNNTSTAGYAGAISYSANVRSQGLVIKNCWFGDVTTGAANWVTLRGDSTVFIGNFMGNNSTGNMLYLINCNGFHSSGNYFTGCYDVYYFDNTGGSCTQFVDDGTNVSNNVSNAVYDGLSNQTSFTQATIGHNIGSNGFLENWGKTSALNVATPTAITFDKAFSVAPYVVLVSTESSSTASNTVNISTAATTTGFSVTVTGTGTSKVNWYAKGLA